jgi:hypothetical protein
MGSHRRKWGWWLVAAIAVAVAASLFLSRRPAVPTGQSETSVSDASSASSVEAESAGTVIRDTVYVKVDNESVPVIRERKVEVKEPAVAEGSTDVASAEAGSVTAGSDSADPVAAAEMIVTVPTKDLNNLVRGKSGRDITLSTQAPDRITMSYAGKVDVPMLGEQNMNFSVDFKVVEVKGDRLVLQLDSGAAMNAAADLLAPRILERLPAGLVDSYANGRAVINLSAVPALQKQLKSMDIVGFSLDENAIRLHTVEK